jgi:hypothetical protein
MVAFYTGMGTFGIGGGERLVEEELGGGGEILVSAVLRLRSRGTGSDKVDGCFEFAVYEAR